MVLDLHQQVRMIIFTVVLLGILTIFVPASPLYLMQQNRNSPHPNYQFVYAVRNHKTGDFKDHIESRRGSEVRGQYSVVEPDGSVRIVFYTADDRNGFRTMITRYGNIRPLKRQNSGVQSVNMKTGGIG